MEAACELNLLKIVIIEMGILQKLTDPRDQRQSNFFKYGPFPAFFLIHSSITIVGQKKEEYA